MKKRLVAVILLMAYAAMLIKVMVFKDLPTIRLGHLMLNFSGRESGHPPNLMPLRTILPYLLGRSGLIIGGINIAGNIALLVPVGFLVPLIYPRIAWKMALALGIGCGLTIEILQTVLKVGIFDIDDVILNALGVTAGYWAYLLLEAWLRSRRYGLIAFALSALAAVPAAAVYAINASNPLRPVDSRAGEATAEPGRPDAGQTGDLCRGTGGTGRIVSLGGDKLTIQRRDGALQDLHLTDRTVIRTLAGAVSRADLKTGDHVTVVIDASEGASAVLVCAAG
jgi:glycopeptide antibiotics resistance protein